MMWKLLKLQSVLLLALSTIGAAKAAQAAQAEAPDEGGAMTLDARVDEGVMGINDKLVKWRRDLHAHPELSNREFRTAEVIAAHLRALGMTVTTDVAHTGVVGYLRGRSEHPLVALRSDMDALPVTEQVDLPFASGQGGVSGSRGGCYACLRP